MHNSSSTRPEVSSASLYGKCAAIIGQKANKSIMRKQNDRIKSIMIMRTTSHGVLTGVVESPAEKKT